MPPVREHSHSSDEEIFRLLGRRGKKSPSINTRASRVGVTNFINVIKSLHPGESISYFPITKETLEQYIDSKRKANIKARSLEQYLQHIQAYNLALGFGWDGQSFGPIIKKALDGLRLNEETIMLAQSSQVDASPDPSNKNANRITRMLTIGEDNPIDEPMSLDEKSSKMISMVCFNTKTILEQCIQISLDNIKHVEPLLNLRQLYSNISSATMPPSWGSVDLLGLRYRIGTRDDSQHFELNDESAFVRFWTSFNEQEEVQLIVYRKNNSCSQVANHNSKRSEPLPHFRVVDTPTLKSITIRSKERAYKQRIAVSDTTTFASLISFAIVGTPPSGKQFVIRDSARDFEYMPNDIVKEVIKGVEHADVTVTIEDIFKYDDHKCNRISISIKYMNNYSNVRIN